MKRSSTSPAPRRCTRAAPAESLARLALKIEREIGITVSIGLSHNKFLAKIASDLNKPRGFSVIGKAETLSFLADKPVRFVWGIGQKTSDSLAKDGLTTLGQIQSMAERDLAARYGKLGAHLWHLARGQDSRIVDPEGETKSVSAETTFDVDIADLEALKHELWPLCEKVSRAAEARRALPAATCISSSRPPASASSRARCR